MKPIKKITADKLQIEVYESRGEMGRAAGIAAAKHIRRLLTEKNEINIIFAAAPSQNEMLAALIAEKGIDWKRINAFHMDEYIGLADDAPQRFGNFLERYLFSLVPFKSVCRIDCTAVNPDAECKRYTNLLVQYKPDLVCLGIGENGHIAFNDPGEAKFDDPELVKIVALDEICRQQQVNDGCFAKIAHVPTHALTLTVPALMSAPHLICTVPAKSKRNAVRKTALGIITEDVPATAMRLHSDCIMFCDSDSGADL